MNTGVTVQKDSPRQAILAGLSSGFSIPAGHGEHVSQYVHDGNKKWSRA